MTSMLEEQRLLPYEQALARMVLRRQAERRTPSVLRSERNYGEQGVVLLAAGLTDGLVAELMLLAGILLVALPPQQSQAVALAGSFLLVLAMLLMGLTVIRLRQAARLGRSFRGDRPFARRRDV